jgi:D-glycero-alpha-D-manno-heptose-7-phosphate kinase
MIANTEAQAELHPALVSAQARGVIELARRHGAVGWKVNGAGGEGGSLTILCGPESEKKRAFVKDVQAAGTGCQVIPTYLARMGLRRWETTA